MKNLKSTVKVIFFCKFPPPFTGQTIGTKVIYRSVRKSIELEKIDTSYGKIKPRNFGFNLIVYSLLFSISIVKNIVKLRSKVNRGGFDVVYLVASPSLLGILKNLLTVNAVQAGTDKIVAHVRNGNYHEVFEKKIYSWLAKKFVKSTDRFIFLSEKLESKASNYIPQEKSSIVRNSIDKTVRCASEEVDTKILHRGKSSDFRILYLSNMIPSKGYMDVARALRMFHGSIEGLSLTADFIGAWPNERSLADFDQFISENGLREVINVHGRVSDRETIRGAYLDADVFVLPTYYPNEAQPRTIIEAFNAGTPVIATEHASIPEYVFDDKNGYLVEKQSPSQIKQCLEELSDRSKWQKKARAARRTYEEMFSPDAVRDAMLRAIRGTE